MASSRHATTRAADSLHRCTWRRRRRRRRRRS